MNGGEAGLRGRAEGASSLAGSVPTGRPFRFAPASMTPVSALPARLAAAAALLALAAPLAAQPARPAAALDTVTARPLDGGKMWLFEDPPTDYLAATYGFRPDAAWYRRARLASLRMPGCSASFVSPHGLVATNHHCAEGAVVAVDRGGEGLLDGGFTAQRLADERRAPEMTMDQLVATEDVTAEMSAAVDAATTAEARTAATAAATAAITARLLAARGVADPADAAAPFAVQVVALYDGGRYSAYTFRRYRDVRLVMAPELRLGAFGGDYDNFTYPRYAADFAFFRVYGDDGRPLASPDFFPLSTRGVARDSVVFVVGNPGSTSRGLTVAELETLRDVELPATVRFVDSRVDALLAALAASAGENTDALRAQIQGLRNSQKAFRGRLRGLQDPAILARRGAAERDFRTASPEAGALIGQQAALQTERRGLARQTAAFSTLFNRRYGSATMRRALLVASGRSAEAAAVATPAATLERAYLAAELAQLQAYFDGAGDGTPKVFQSGGTPEEIADRVLATSAAARAETAAGAPLDDPAVALVARIRPDYEAFLAAEARLDGREAEVRRQLGRTRFATFGAAVPPDATFSLRFTDGVVRGYDYNGTEAPPVTTLFGVYDRYRSFCVAGAGAPAVTGPDGQPACDWQLPQRWLDAEDDLDLATPVNFTSTSDTIGGNSGSPVVNRSLELVGLNFDRTIEGLVRDYLYAPERGRNVMVDARFVVEALREVYDMGALADELTEGTLRR